jgi:Zn-dependent protease with chaperone function
MTRDAFEALITRLDTSWRDQPNRLMFRTIGMGILGYIALLAAIGGGLAVSAAAAYLIANHADHLIGKLAVVFLVCGLIWSWLVLRCLWVKLETPQGLPLTSQDTPELFELIAATGNRAGGIKFHEVLVDGGLNASMIQMPRLGVFGWYRNTLVIGLPLLQALSLEEFQAVLAHEFAHSGQSDGKIGSWLYRTRRTWERVAERMNGTSLCPLFTKFFQWFWPRINAPALVLSRSSEFACDRFAARLTSPEILARGLRRLAIQGQRTEEEFWKPLFRTAKDLPDPPPDAMERLMHFLREPVEAAKAIRWLGAELKFRTKTFSTHPSLMERLERLGDQAEAASTTPPPALSRTAAEALLPHSFSASVQAKLSQQWSDTTRAEWWIRHQGAKEGDAEGQRGENSREIRQAWNRIAALARLDGLAKVQSDIIALLNRKPDHCGALFLRGAHLAKEGDPHAIGFLERAANDPTLAVQTFETLAEYHDRAGQKEEFAAVKRRANLHERTLRAALVERNHVGLRDSFLPHALPDCQITSLKEILGRHPCIQRAWLVEKHVRHFPAWRHYLLVLDLRSTAISRAESKSESAVLSKILDDWDVDGYVLALREHPENRRLVKVIRHACPESAVYRR